jgi:hypothetical protein
MAQSRPSRPASTDRFWTARAELRLEPTAPCHQQTAPCRPFAGGLLFSRLGRLGCDLCRAVALAGVVIPARAHGSFGFYSRSRSQSRGKAATPRRQTLSFSRHAHPPQPVWRFDGKSFQRQTVVCIGGRRLRCGPGEQRGLARIEDRESSKSPAS